jgi:DNA-binding SARP family transcriptional activator
VRCDLVPALVLAGLADEARAEVAAARGEAIAARAPRAVARAELLAAALAPDAEAARAPLTLALALTRRYALDDLWTLTDRERAAPLLARALSYGAGSAAVAERLLSACGGEVLAEAVDGLDGSSAEARERLAGVAERAEAIDPATLEPLARDHDPAVREAARRAQASIRSRPRPPLRLVTLGSFSVLRGGVELSETALGRPRVRSLMAVLVAASGPLHRELLLEWLWPSLPPQRGLRSLHTTVFELRRALEPEADRVNGGGIVRTEGESYRLALDERDDWDAETFLALVRAGASGNGADPAHLERLSAAEAAYTGEFLPECRYAPWAAARRAEVEQAYDDTLERLAEALVGAGQPGAAIRRYRRLLARDAECERHHRGLMRAYAAAGDRALALRQFHACRALIRQRLGTEPSPETRALFASLL